MPQAEGLKKLGPTRAEVEETGALLQVSPYLLLQLCLQVADELIFALHDFQQFLVFSVQAPCGVHILQIGQFYLLFHHSHLKSTNALMRSHITQMVEYAMASNVGQDVLAHDAQAEPLPRAVCSN